MSIHKPPHIELILDGRIICPFCKKNNTLANGFESNTKNQYHRVWCLNCRKSFHTDYTKSQWLKDIKQNIDA